MATRKLISSVVTFFWLLAFLWGITVLGPIAERMEFLMRTGFYVASAAFWAMPLKPLHDWANTPDEPDEPGPP